MTREEKIAVLKDIIDGEIVHPQVRKDVGAWAIKALEQEPCKVSEYDKDHIWYKGRQYISLRRFLEVKAEAEQEPKTGHCKDCKYFEYDKWLYINEMPVIVAHEVCNRLIGGLKTKEDGFCFMFEKKEDKENG